MAIARASSRLGSYVSVYHGFPARRLPCDRSGATALWGELRCGRGGLEHIAQGRSRLARCRLVPRHDGGSAGSAAQDRTALAAQGYAVRVIRESPAFLEATVAKAGNTVILPWVRDSAFRFPSSRRRYLWPGLAPIRSRHEQGPRARSAAESTRLARHDRMSRAHSVAGQPAERIRASVPLRS